MEHSYAQALLQIIQSGMAPKKAVQALYDLLVSRGRTALMPRIARALTRMVSREEARNSVVLSVAREKEAAKAKRDARSYLFEMDVKAGDVSINLDDSLIGGWRLEGKERLLDASWKKDLLSIYNRSTA